MPILKIKYKGTTYDLVIRKSRMKAGNIRHKIELQFPFISKKNIHFKGIKVKERDILYVHDNDIELKN